MTETSPDPSAAARANAQALERFQKGLALHQKGQLNEAEEYYRQAVSLHPRHFDALHLLGVIALQRGQYAQALTLIDTAVAIDPRSPVYVNAHVNRGVVLRHLGQPQAAVESFNRAIAIKPSHAEALFNRGIAERTLNNEAAAVASFSAAITLQPKNVDALFNRGLSLSALRQHNAALASYDAAIALKPDHAEAHNNRANALAELKAFAAAVAAYDAAIQLKGAKAYTYNNRGHALRALGRFEEAIDSYGKALELDPRYPYLPGLRLLTKMQICDWNGIEGEIAALVDKVMAGEKASASFALLALTDTPAVHRKCAETWTRDRYPQAFEHLPAPGPHGKIRVGYFSPDFRDHPTAALTAGLFEAHDRSRFEVVAFSYGADTKDAARKRLEAGFDRFIDVRDKSDAEVAALARTMEIDIAVDLAGHTTDARSGIFARRAAPLQVAYLGYPGTMAADYIDYLLADGVVIPEAARADYTEKVVTLPHSYQVNDARRTIAGTVYTRAQLGLERADGTRAFVYCCFNNNFKITPATFAGWMRILKQVDHALLWLLEDNPAAARNLRAEAKRQGVDPARLVFAPRMAQAEHLARHRAADLFLDTLPYNAHTTASDALWTGLPVLTCMGESFAARVAASLLRAVELPELITTTPVDFEALAVALARDPARLAALKEKLGRNRLTAALFDTKQFTRHIEAAFTRMIERQRAGRAPEHMAVAL